MANHKINQKWFASRLEDRELSQRQFAKRLGLDPSAVTLLFQGKRAMKMGEAADIARLLGVPVADVLENAGLQTESGGIHEVPMVGWIDHTGELHQENKRYKIPAPISLPSGSAAAQYRTVGSDAQNMDGWTIFYKQPTGGVDPASIGKQSVVKIRGGVMMVAQVRRGYRPTHFNLFGNVQIMDADLEWATPVIWIKP